MSRIVTPATVEAAPAGSQPLLNAVKAKFGSVPNLFRLVGASPAVLEGYVGFNGGLQKGTLTAATRERIALAVANINRCTYCNNAHTVLGKLAKLTDGEIEAARLGSSSDPKADAAVKFAALVARNRGQVTDSDVAAVKNAGYSEAELIEIVGHVALNVFTNYVNETFKTEIDFPAATLAKAA